MSLILIETYKAVATSVTSSSSSLPCQEGNSAMFDGTWKKNNLGVPSRRPPWGGLVSVQTAFHNTWGVLCFALFLDGKPDLASSDTCLLWQQVRELPFRLFQKRNHKNRDPDTSGKLRQILLQLLSWTSRVHAHRSLERPYFVKSSFPLRLASSPCTLSWMHSQQVHVARQSASSWIPSQ